MKCVSAPLEERFSLQENLYVLHLSRLLHPQSLSVFIYVYICAVWKETQKKKKAKRRVCLLGFQRRGA